MKKLMVWMEWGRNDDREYLELPSNWDTVPEKRRGEIADSLWSDWMSQRVQGGHEVVEVDE